MGWNRRDILRAGAVTAAGGLSAGCPGLRRAPATEVTAPAPALPPGGRAAWAVDDGAGLARVDVAQDRLIRTVVGLRPFRATGFRVEVESFGGKLLAHNYGHGGAGITFSWGTSQLAVEEALAAVAESNFSTGWADDDGAAGQTTGLACAVIGCGVMGLSTAVLMQQQGWRVTIYAKDVPPHTTSNVAGGLWGPHAVSDPGRTTAAYEAQFVRAARIAHERFQEMVGDHYGVRWVDNYVLSDQPQPQPWFEAGTQDLYPGSRVLTTEEYPFPQLNARRHKTLLIEPHTYLRALLRDFYLAGGRLIVRELIDRDDLTTLPEPLLFNCTGLGAAELVDDEEMVPIRGQLSFLVPQPEVDYTVIAGDLYMFPRSDGILLGGTHERGDWSLEPDTTTRDRIVRAHAELFGDDAGPGGAAGSGPPPSLR